MEFTFSILKKERGNSVWNIALAVTFPVPLRRPNSSAACPEGTHTATEVPQGKDSVYIGNRSSLEGARSQDTCELKALPKHRKTCELRSAARKEKATKS